MRPGGFAHAGATGLEPMTIATGCARPVTADATAGPLPTCHRCVRISTAAAPERKDLHFTGRTGSTRPGRTPQRCTRSASPHAAPAITAAQLPFPLSHSRPSRQTHDHLHSCPTEQPADAHTTPPIAVRTHQCDLSEGGTAYLRTAPRKGRAHSARCADKLRIAAASARRHVRGRGSLGTAPRRCLRPGPLRHLLLDRAGQRRVRRTPQMRHMPGPRRCGPGRLGLPPQ